MDILFTKKEELVGYVAINGNVGCSDHETVELEIQRRVRKEVAEYRREDLRLFRELVGGNTRALKSEGAQGNSQVFKEGFITILRKPSRVIRILIWLSRKAMRELQWGKKKKKVEAGPDHKGGI